MANADIKARMAALFARASDQVLATSLRALDANPNPNQEVRLCRAWTIEELERRHPAAEAAVGKAFEDNDLAETDVPPVDYVAVLLGAIPSVR